jgi:hypothetical protein
MVATIVPAVTGNRARRPSVIRTPAAIPAAGQNTATPSGLVSRSRLSRAARKYAIPTAMASPIELTHRIVGSEELKSCSTCCKLRNMGHP